MKQYRLVESAPADGKRYGKAVRSTVWTGVDKDALKQAIDTWHAQLHRKAYAELAYYYGSRRIYAYEL